MITILSIPFCLRYDIWKFSSSFFESLCLLPENAVVSFEKNTVSYVFELLIYFYLYFSLVMGGVVEILEDQQGPTKYSLDFC